MKKQNRTYTDSILMRLCKNKARQKGYYSDEPQYKAYCTKLYNATKEGRGLSGLAGDASNVDTAERLTKIFKAIGFPYRVEAQGKFLDFYDINPDADEPILFDDEAEDVFYDQFGKVVNFKILISQFYDRDDKVKKYVEKILSQKSRAKQSVVEPTKREAVEAKHSKSRAEKSNNAIEQTEETGARKFIANLEAEVYDLIYKRMMIDSKKKDAYDIERAKSAADVSIEEISEALKGKTDEQIIQSLRLELKTQKNAYDRALEEANDVVKSEPAITTKTNTAEIDPQYSVNAIKSGMFSDKQGNSYEWSLVDMDEASRLMKKYGILSSKLIADVFDNYMDSVNKIADFFDAEPIKNGRNAFYAVVLRKNNGVPFQMAFGYNDPNDPRTGEYGNSLFLHVYPWQNIITRRGANPPDKQLYECDTVKAFTKHIGIKLKFVTFCNKKEETLNDVSNCCNGSGISDDMQSLDQIVEELKEKHDIELDTYEYKDHIVISRIVVPKSKRNEGIGTEVIEAIIDYADEQSKDVFVTPTGDFGGSTSRLAKFYKRFGFVPNKGKYRDFRTRESMIYKAEGMNDDMSRHQAPYRDDEGFFQPAYDVSRMFPGIYTSSFSKALREYGTGSDSDPESLQIIRNIQNNPEAKVKIYRAVEKGLRDNINDLKKDRDYIKRNGSVPPWSDIPPGNTDEYSMFVDSQIENLGAVESATITPTINPKDWVTISRQYAIDHGECCVPGDYTILSKTVKAKDLYTEGNSIHEWGYDPSQDSTLSGDSFTPPKDVQEEAQRGLEWRREYGRGGTEVGVARARDLSNGRSVSYDTVKRMKAFFDRHEVDKQAEGFRPNEQGYPSAGRIAWALWGGDAGYRWAKSIVGKSNDTQGLGFTMFADQLGGTTANVQQREEPKEVAPLTTQEIVNMEPPQTLPLKGELRDFLSSLLAKFNMLIWGGAGSGKSSFVLRLANELAETNTGRVLYYMTEEKVSSGRLKARMDLMKAYSDNVNFDDHGTFDRLTALVNTGMYRYVIVDSINMINIEQTKIVELMQTFPEVSWIFIAQATKGKNAYAGIQSLAHAVDTEIATSNDKGTAVAELKKHRDGALKTHTIFGNTGMRDPKWQAQW